MYTTGVLSPRLWLGRNPCQRSPHGCTHEHKHAPKRMRNTHESGASGKSALWSGHNGWIAINRLRTLYNVGIQALPCARKCNFNTHNHKTKTKYGGKLCSLNRRNSRSSKSSYVHVRGTRPGIGDHYFPDNHRGTGVCTGRPRPLTGSRTVP